MNTDTDSRQDYEIARDELNALFTSLGLVAAISLPVGMVEDGWPCISYTVGIKGETFSYRMGIGLVKWVHPRSSHGSFPLGIEEQLIFGQMRNKQCHPEYLPQLARIAAQLAIKQKAQPNPAEVLACCAREGRDAEESFDNWCATFGYETDSRKALACYDACTENGKKARRILGKHYEQFAELSARL
jgi:hypothetical protein